MSRSSYRSLLKAAATLFLIAVVAPAHGQTPIAEPSRGAAFLCQDGSKMVLSFASTGENTFAVVWLRGASFQLANLPPEPGVARITWSDGEHSLTWNPGVQLMWMGKDTHLMCGRGGHKH